jgi:hypothetical protein
MADFIPWGEAIAAAKRAMQLFLHSKLTFFRNVSAQG